MYIKNLITHIKREMRKQINYEYLKNSDERESVFCDFCKKEVKNENGRSM